MGAHTGRKRKKQTKERKEQSTEKRGGELQRLISNPGGTATKRTKNVFHGGPSARSAPLRRVRRAVVCVLAAPTKLAHCPWQLPQHCPASVHIFPFRVEKNANWLAVRVALLQSVFCNGIKLKHAGLVVDNNDNRQGHKKE
jgi:hypothetical protein